ncbi:MAG: sensor histidine kinase, partial [Hyphomicrobiaceae bacterium]
MLEKVAARFPKSNPDDIEISALYTEFKRLEDGLADPKRKYSLTRYFAVCSAALMLPVLAACAYLQWSGTYDELLAVEEQHNVRMARVLADTVWHRHWLDVMKAGSFGQQNLRSTPKTAEIHKDLKALADEIGLLKVRVYSPGGKTVYSSNLDQIGESKHENATFEKLVARRNPMSRTLYTETFTGFSAVRDVSIVQTYVPIIDKAGDVVSVIEIFTDITRRTTDAKLQTGYVFAAYLASFALLFGAIIFIMMRADRILEAQAATLSENYEQLRANEEELTEAHDQLQDANIDLSRNIEALQQAQQEIVEKGKLAQLGQLTATVAHEIRNPLGSVRTAAYLLQRKIDAEQLGVAKQFKRIETGVKRCDTIITELLDFARRDRLKLANVEIDSWVQSIVASERENVPKMVAMQEQYSLEDLAVQIDRDQLQRVLVNLISNASEAMVGRDGSELSVDDPKIVVATKIVDGNIEIAVTDNGPGIEPENLERIREPLFTTKSFGIGLGIPAVVKILQ